MAQLRLSVNPHAFCFSSGTPSDASHESTVNLHGQRFVSSRASSRLDAGNPVSGISLKLSPSRLRIHTLARAASGYGGDGGEGGKRGGGHGGGGGGGGGDGGRDSGGERSRRSGEGILGLFLEGWRSRVRADPQFPFKVLMEELVGVSACVIGDMASRPNFGLNELDFVFSTLVVGSILNFVLMYLLAPTAGPASASAALSLFSGCPKSHMFEPGAYSLIQRSGTLVYKGAVFATVGLAAGLVGTAISNALLALRKRLDPAFVPQNTAPPTLLNAGTWAIHMGVSSNVRYQTLNGIEFVLARWLPDLGFRTSVVALRCLNNVLGGVSFVVLARLTGSQKAGESEQKKEVAIVGGDRSEVGEVQTDQQKTM